MILTKISVGTGDAPLLVEKALRELGCETFLFPVDEDLPLFEALFSNTMYVNRKLYNRRLLNCAKKYSPDFAHGQIGFSKYSPLSRVGAVHFGT